MLHIYGWLEPSGIDTISTDLSHYMCTLLYNMDIITTKPYTSTFFHDVAFFDATHFQIMRLTERDLTEAAQWQFYATASEMTAA